MLLPDVCCSSESYSLLVMEFRSNSNGCDEAEGVYKSEKCRGTEVQKASDKNRFGTYVLSTG